MRSCGTWNKEIATDNRFFPGRSLSTCWRPPGWCPRHDARRLIGIHFVLMSPHLPLSILNMHSHCSLSYQCPHTNIYYMRAQELWVPSRVSPSLVQKCKKYNNIPNLRWVHYSNLREWTYHMYTSRARYDIITIIFICISKIKHRKQTGQAWQKEG